MTDAFSKNDRDTIIRLDKSDHAQQFDFDNMVHQIEFDDVLRRIGQAAKLAKSDPNKAYLHNTITVVGSRGSGKTSFLLSIKNTIQQKKVDSVIGNQLSFIQVLEIIDPTLIEEKGHVFLNVISLVEGLVEQYLEKRECNYPNNDFSPFTRKAWRSSLNKLAAGLPSIDGIGSHDAASWQDPEFVMDKGLKAVKASQELLKNFNEFLAQSLKIIEKESFLIIFDDIDVDASKGWIVLETIRKYFTGSKLITVISGDLELYTTVVRQEKWKNFGKEILQYEGTDNVSGKKFSEFNRLVTVLTSQYMLKVIQPNNRIHLSTLLHRKRTRPQLGIKVAFDGLGMGQDIEILYDKIHGFYGIFNQVQVEVFNTFLLSQPLRSQIQFLQLFNFSEKNKLRELSETKRSIDNGFVAIFLANLLEQKVDIDLAASSPKYLVPVILKYLIENKILNDLYQLQPTTTNESANASLYSLNLLLSKTIRDKCSFLIFEFFIKVGFLRNLLTELPYESRISDEVTSRPTIEGLCRHAGVFNDGVLRDVTGHMLTYMYSALDSNGGVNGITPFFIRLMGLESIAKKGHENRIDSVFADPTINRSQRTLAFMPCFSGSFGYKNQSRLGYSIYLLIGAIGEIVKMHEIITTRSMTYDDNLLLLKRLLSELGQIRSYPILSFSKRQIEVFDIESEDYSNDQFVETDYGENSDDRLASFILLWLNSVDKNVVATHLLGKISTRFFYAMKNIAEGSSKDIKLGDLFHRQVVTFLNSVLIEDVREHTETHTSKLNINNTNADDGIFLNNLNAIKRSISSLSFSTWIFNCPLLAAFINPESKVIDALKKYQNGFLTSEFSHRNESSLSIFQYLNLVTIYSQEDMQSSSDYQEVVGTPRLLNTPLRLVEILKQYAIPFTWFETSNDRRTTAQYNKFIKRFIKSVFLDDNRTATRIRNFRRYLQTKNISW